MKLSELTSKQLKKIAKLDPDWCAEHRPDLLVRHRQEWCARYRPELLVRLNPEWCVRYNPEWCARYRPELLTRYNPEWIEPELPPEIEELLKEENQ